MTDDLTYQLGQLAENVTGDNLLSTQMQRQVVRRAIARIAELEAEVRLWRDRFYETEENLLNERDSILAGARRKGGDT